MLLLWEIEADNVEQHISSEGWDSIAGVVNIQSKTEHRWYQQQSRSGKSIGAGAKNENQWTLAVGVEAFRRNKGEIGDNFRTARETLQSISKVGK